MAATAAAAQTQRSETFLKEWEFRKGHDIQAIDGWEKVTVPHDWAIYGPFDKANDLQTVAVVQNGEDKATEKTGRTGGLPYMGKGIYRCTLEISEAELDGRRHILMFDGAMSEAQVIVNGAKVCFYNRECIIFGQRIGDIDIQIARIAFLAIFRAIVQRNGIGRLSYNIPHLFIETMYATMQRISPIVDWQLVAYSIYGELTIFDTIGIATNNSIEIGFLLLPFFKSREA